MTLQCGSVSGTEITRCSSARSGSGSRSLQCGSVSGTEITKTHYTLPTDGLAAAMRLRLRDGDHYSADMMVTFFVNAAMRLRL
ncbi:hypothetical protein, partial [Mycolicibacterium hassiacum]|uniref:hypothetical protein n=1 Tax=Mycolicibacterium hassiacum TaxID=46351 RepID=UPI003908A2C3